MVKQDAGCISRWNTRSIPRRGLSPGHARKAHWATCYSATANNEPTFEHYVHQELKALLTWEPLKGNHAVVHKFFNSLMHFIQEGTFKAVLTF